MCIRDRLDTRQTGGDLSLFSRESKKVMVDLTTPASFNQRPRVEKISKMGTPAENPKNNIVITRG